MIYKKMVGVIAGMGLAWTLAPVLAQTPAAQNTTPVGTQTPAKGEVITTNRVREAETEAGNLLADAVRNAAGAEIALFPAAAFKTGVSVPRPATAEQATELIEPSTDIVVVVNLRGDRILAALERSVSFAPQPFAGFLHVSGVKFSFDPKRDTRKRVFDVTVNGSPLEASRTYKVAMPRPLASGQQGYHQVWDKTKIDSETGKTLAQSLAELAKARGGTLSTSVENRIIQAGS
jgi:2',3'-cyclic-nucleotide 2'-phosphodiesterase (5'-nucleotidase family)